MKYHYYFALSMMMLGTQLLFAQCPPAQAIGILDANNISAAVLTAGNLFTTGPEGHFKYLPAPGTPSTIFSTGFWVAGVKSNGEIAISTTSYRGTSDTEQAFQPGPLEDFTNEPFDCSNWDRVFTVTKAEVESFLQDRLALSEQQLIEQYPGVMGWPSVGNRHFEQVHNFPMPNRYRSLAPYLDYTSNGLYEPLEGDVPGLELGPPTYRLMPDELVWCIMNDKPENNPSPLGIELHLTAWAFNCEDNPVLKDVVFTRHHISYALLDTNILTNAYMGLFTDVDLGCYLDDFVGSHPASNTLFAYNQDAIDGDVGSNCTGGVASFGEATPVQSITFLNRPLSKSAAWSTGSTPADPNPNIPIHRYNLMRGVWPDGQPFTQGGVGYNPGSTEVVDHLFSGDPADPNAWSMCNSSIAFPDTRLLGTTFLDTLERGQQAYLYTAWMVTPDVDAPCSIGNTLERVAEVQAAFDDTFGSCGALVGIDSSPDVTEAFFIAPNPASDRFTVDLSRRGQLRLLAADGRVLMQDFFEAGKHEIGTRAFPAGWYVVQHIQEGQVFTSRLVISR